MPAVIKSTEAAGIAVVDEDAVQAAPFLRHGDQLPAGRRRRQESRRAAHQEVQACSDGLHREGRPQHQGRLPLDHGNAAHAGQDRQRLPSGRTGEGQPAFPRSGSPTAATRSAAASSRKRSRRSSPSARTAAAPATAALARLLNATCWCSRRCRTGALTGSRRRWRVSSATARCCTTRRRNCASCTRAWRAARWTGPIRASSRTSTGRRTGCRPRLITTLHQIIENGLKEYDRGF